MTRYLVRWMATVCPVSVCVKEPCDETACPAVCKGHKGKSVEVRTTPCVTEEEARGVAKTMSKVMSEDPPQNGESVFEVVEEVYTQRVIGTEKVVCRRRPPTKKGR